MPRITREPGLTWIEECDHAAPSDPIYHDGKTTLYRCNICGRLIMLKREGI